MNNKAKSKTPGIVYLSRIPRGMNVKRIREELAEFGEIGNVFLNANENAVKIHRMHVEYKEGWVEFRDKSMAENVATLLNNTQVDGKKKHPWYADIWNLKYLPGLKWAMLKEREVYEQETRKNRLFAEKLKIKRESGFHKDNYKKSRKIAEIQSRKRQKGEATDEEEEEYIIRQLHSEEDYLSNKCLNGNDKSGPPKRRKQQKQSIHRPDGTHAVGALSLAAHRDLLHKLFAK